MTRSLTLIITLLLLKVSLIAQKNSAAIKKCIPLPDVHMGQAVYRFTDNMPVFQTGSSDFIKYISKNINYPEGNKESSLRSTFHTTFIVDTLGKVQNVCCLTNKDYYEPIEKQLIELIEKSSGWIPGTINGKKVCVRLTVPISIHFK